MPTPLRNDRWGYETNCFVCEPSNAVGLQIPFQLDDDQQTVSASFTLGADHSGAPTLVHGGVSLAILDEVQAWACIAVAAKWALTQTTSATFHAPVLIDIEHRAEAIIVDLDERSVGTSGRILDSQGAVLVEATSTFVIVGDVAVEQRSLGLDPNYERRLLPDSPPDN